MTPVVFSGLIEACVPLRGREPRGTGARLVVAEPGASELAGEPWSCARGDSISVSGCCLTVAEIAADGAMAFDLSAETLEKTCLGQVAAGQRVNLERSVRLTDRMGGHLVSGHVDGVGRIAGIEDVGDGGRVFSFEVPEGMERYLVDKGSVCIDGISLTVVDPRGRTFDVAVIPETLKRTNLGSADVGQGVHVEADMIGKWVEKLLARRS